MEAWDTLYKRKRQEQREERGARVRYQQLRQEIADLAIARSEHDEIMLVEIKTQEYLPIKTVIDRLVKELRALEQQYPSVKEEA